MDSRDAFKVGSGEEGIVRDAVGMGKRFGFEDEEADAVAVEACGRGKGGIGDDTDAWSGKPEFAEGGALGSRGESAEARGDDSACGRNVPVWPEQRADDRR